VDGRAVRLLCANFSEGAWLDEVLAGTVSLQVDSVQEPFVDADDIADVVAEIGAAEGRDISFVSVPLEDYTAMLTEYGLPQDFIWLLNYLFTEVLGSKVQLGDGVQRALGRDPKDFAEYVREAAATGVWTPSV
jgi:hypothetical protein